MDSIILEVVRLWVGVTKELKESSKIQILEDTKDQSSAKILTLSFIWRKR